MSRKRERLYIIWCNMKSRCNNENNQDYALYGGRGIEICSAWSNGYLKFKDWAVNNGYKDNLTIDRISSNGNYEPSNCRWSTMEEQQNNKRNNVLIEIDGIIKTMSQWSKESGIGIPTIVRRIKLGWKNKELISPIRDEAHKKSGIKGITWNKNKQEWYVRVYEMGKMKQIYQTEDLELAKTKLKEHREGVGIG